jgi:hypothetical protein
MTNTRLPQQFTHSRAPQAPVLRRLHDEWTHLSIRASELRAVRSWGLPGAPVQSLDDVLARCGYRAGATVAGDVRDHYAAGDDDAHDDYLLRIVALARTNSLAARIVLQRILPGLSAAAGRHSNNSAQRHGVLDDLVANAWPIIRNYPVERRPRRIVSNLVRDTAFQTFVRPVRRRSSGEIPTTHDRLHESAVVQNSESLDELVALLHEARRKGMAQADIDLICQLVSLGSTDEVALLHNVTPRTIRNHRSAVVHRLRSIAAEAA